MRLLQTHNGSHHGDITRQLQTVMVTSWGSDRDLAKASIVIQCYCSFLSVKCNFDRLYNHLGFCPCVSVCVCLSTDRLSNDYVRNSLQIFTKFCMQLRNVVLSNAIVSGINRK